MGDLLELAAPLREPKNDFQRLVRRLAEAAMSVTHHDASEHEPGYISEVRSMERRFSLILRGKVRTRTPSAVLQHGGDA